MSEPKPRKPRPLRLVLALAGVALVVVAGLLYLNRRTLAREALTGWLRSKGIAAEAQVEAIGPSAFAARLRVGDPARPDFAADRAYVRYRMTVRGLEVTSVTLTRPTLRASLHGGRLSAGSLDPLIEEFRRRPPRPNAARPRIQIDDGVLHLATDYGPLRLTADALVDDNKLMSLAATSAPARLRGRAFDISIGAAAVQAATRGGQIDAAFAAPLPQVTAGGVSVRDAQLRLQVQAPYPDLERRRGEGPLSADLGLSGRDIDLGQGRLAKAELSAAFVGRVSGWVEDLATTGRGTATLRAEGGEIAGLAVRTLKVAGTAEDVRWTRRGGDAMQTSVNAKATLENLSAGDLRAPALTLAVAGPVAHGRQGFEAQLAGTAIGRAGWSGLGTPTNIDSPAMAALKRAARSFRIAAPQVGLRFKGGGLAVLLPQPARLVPDSGGAVVLASRGGAAVYAPAGAGFRLTASGGGLPTIDADVARLTVGPHAATAVGRVQAKLTFDPLVGADLDVAGTLRVAGDRTIFTAQRCARIAAERLELGGNDIEDISGRFCPTGGPLMTLAGAQWRLVGRAEGGAASIPFLQARVEDAAARVAYGSRGADIGVETARVADTAPNARFRPVSVAGEAKLTGDVWRADLEFRIPNGSRIAEAHLVHDALTGGGVTIETGDLAFAEGGLQPQQLSPMAAVIGSPAVGLANFSGRFDWNAEGATSSGVIAIPGLDFESPVGRVSGLSGRIELTSLAPLTAAPGQEVRIARIDAIVPLTDLTASFAVSGEVLRIAGGEAAVGGGTVRVEALEAPFDHSQPIKGILHFDKVQLHDIVEASPFGDKAELDAVVSGRVPFEAVGNRVRITGGSLAAVQPGRLSIDREALTGVQAGGEVTGPAGATAEIDPNATFTDFAYQAMENLAFDTLAASISSREDGRLGVLFQIVGRHDPPQQQQIRLSIMDLIQRRFLGRKLPLPSGTGVNLTLDTSLNLDDLLADYAEYQRLHGSATVQP